MQRSHSLMLQAVQVCVAVFPQRSQVLIVTGVDDCGFGLSDIGTE